MSSYTLPVHPDHVHEELESVEKIVGKWRARVNDGIVGIDLPGADAEEKLEAFLRELTGELYFVAGKCHNLATILTER